VEKGEKKRFVFIWHIYANLRPYIKIYTFNIINYVYVAYNTQISLNSIINVLNGGDLYEGEAAKQGLKLLSYY